MIPLLIPPNSLNLFDRFLLRNLAIIYRQHLRIKFLNEKRFRVLLDGLVTVLTYSYEY